MPDIAEHLLEEKPIRRFEVFGAVDKVVREVDLHVPEIFGAAGEKILEPLKSIIRSYAANQGWGEMALSLSQGMARAELDELLERDIGHVGPLVIDPNASTEEHQVYQSQTHAKLQKDRLVRLHEADGENILTVLYGIESADANTMRTLLAQRARMADITLELAMEEDATIRARQGLGAMQPQLQRRLQLVRRRLKDAHNRLGTVNDLNEDAHGDLYLALITLVHMQGLAAQSSAVRNLTRQLGVLPQQFEHFGLDFNKFQALPEAKPAAPESKPVYVPPAPQLKR